MLRAALRIDRRRGDVRDVAVNLGRLANVLAMAGRAEQAAQLLVSSSALFEQLGVKDAWWIADRNEKTRALLREQLESETLARLSEAGRRLSLDEAVDLALGEPT